MPTPDIWAPRAIGNVITRRHGAEWIAFRQGDEKRGARGYGDTEEAAIRNLTISFPDDGPMERVLQ